jgi:signal transduction histidine kinase
LNNTAPSPKAQIEKRKIELLYENVLLSQGFSIVNASILTWLRYDEQAFEMTIWWLLVMLAVVIRFSTAWAFHSLRNRLSDHGWLRIKTAATACSGVIWGGGAVLMLSQGSAWDVMLAAFTIAGMAAAAVPLLAAHLPIYWLYSSLMLAPCIVTLLSLPGSKWTYSIVLMTALFWLTLLSSSRRFANALHNELSREAELMVALDKAEEASRAKSVFLANISHEIRTPMNGLLGIAEVLLLSDLDDQQADMVQVLNQSGRSMMDVLNQILDFTELEAGRHQISSVRCSPAALINTVLQMFEASARIKGLALHCDISPDLPDWMLAAPREIVNVMTTLVGNAIKFTESGVIDLSLWCGHEIGQGDDDFTLYFSVSDTGPGIPPQQQDRIFGAFTQVDESASRDFGGIGLGLAIARRTVEILGGNISVESKLGNGSRFFVYLPVKRS